MAITITLQTVVNFASTHADLLPLTGVGGFTNEPALSICNDAISDLIGGPNDWKFNRKVMPMFVTCPQKQDYKFAGAVAFSTSSTAQGWAIDLSSNNAITVTAGVVTVRTIEAHRFAIGDTIYMQGVVMSTGTAANYNSVFTDNGSATAWTVGWVITGVGATSFTFAATAGQNNADVGGAPGITDFGWCSSGSMAQLINSSSPQFTQEVTAYRELPVTSMVANPINVSVLADDQAGTLTIRLYKCPGSTTWAVNLVYQAAAPVKTALSQTWAPFPDSYSAIYRQAVIARMYRYLNSPRAEVEYQKLQQEIAKMQGGDDAEESSVSLKPEEPLMSLDNSWWGW